MSVIIPQVLTEDRASGAQIIDGSLKFDQSKSQYLTRTPGSAGNRRTFTISFWRKGQTPSANETILHAGPTLSGNSGYWDARIITNGKFGTTSGSNGFAQTTALHRDIGWYHVVIATDTNQASGNQHKIYVNGVLQSLSQDYNASGVDTAINQSGVLHHIGSRLYSGGSQDSYLDSYISQYYFVDGQQLDASYFGFTDGLTNTWKPKKYEGTFGTNGFYLPMDGNSPIGQDQSGNGNNWTPVNFGGSNTIEKATGALPILNTDGGGKVARVGVRTDEYASNLVLALPLVGSANDVSNQINSGSTTKAVTNTGVEFLSESSNFYNGSAKIFDTDKLNVTESNSDFTFGTSTDFTIECWTLITSGHYYGRIIEIGTVNNNAFLVDGDGPGGATSFRLRYDYNGSVTYSSYGIVLNKWHHVAAVRNSGTLTFYIDGIASGTADLSSSNLPGGNAQIGNYLGSNLDYDGYIQDLRIYKGVAKYTQNFIPASTDPDILPDTPSGVAYSSNVALVPSTDGAVSFDGTGDYLSVGGGTDMQLGTGDFTIETFAYFNSVSSGQIYEGRPDATQGAYISIYFESAGNLVFYTDTGTRITASNITSNRWYHVALVRESSTTKFYIDGVSAGSYSDTLDYTVRTDGPVIGVSRNLSNNPLNGFLSNYRIIKGTALYTSDFTPPTSPLTNVTNTKLLCCKSQTSATAFDVSPGTITANGNAAATNFNPFTANINAVRGQESGYCTLNPIGLGGGTISNGNLRSTTTSTTPDVGNFVMSSGKWYWEVNLTTSSNPRVGVYNIAAANPTNLGATANGWCLINSPSRTYNNNSTVSYGDFAGNTGDVVMVAYNADTGRIWYGVNGRFFASGDPAAGNNASQSSVTGNGIVPAVASGTGSNVFDCNFGQKPFKFPPPAGFQPLALANTPRPTIVRPDQYVGIVTYTGNATSRSINVGFKPDLVWLKRRGTTSESHVLANTVVGANAFLSSDLANAENTASNCVTGFTNNGFTVGTQGIVNDNTMPFVAWCWKAGGNSNTFNIDDVGYDTAESAGLTAGTITPTGASVNTKSGFSIIGYTANLAEGGATISHGLGRKPAFAIFKNRDSTLGVDEVDWGVYHQSLGATKKLELNQTLAEGTFDGPFNNTEPTSSLFYFGGRSGGSIQGHSYLTNGPANDRFIGYIWAEIPGFSKFGSYTGNGNADGPFVELGFRPQLIIIKRYNISGSWMILDAARNTYNLVNNKLSPSSSVEENNDSIVGSGDKNSVDFLSNGFKLRSTNGETNGSTYDFIYAAWAEAPTFNLYGGQANAR